MLLEIIHSWLEEQDLIDKILHIDQDTISFTHDRDTFAIYLHPNGTLTATTYRHPTCLGSRVGPKNFHPSHNIDPNDPNFLDKLRDHITH